MGKIRVLLLWVGTLVITAACGTAAAGEPSPATVRKTTTYVELMPAQTPPLKIEGAEALLIADGDGATLNLETTLLNPGHVYTAWWIVINEPDQCANFPCQPSDVLEMTDLVRSDITFADGLVVGDSGVGIFQSYLPAGDLPEGWFGNGFRDPLGAEIHVTLHDHGPLIPELAQNMLSTYRGGCTDGSLMPVFPEFTKEFGEQGTNTCQMVQVAFFLPESEE